MMDMVWIVVLTIGLVWLAIMRYSVRSLARSRPGTSLVRKRLWCPTMEQEAEVEFLVEDGMPSAILHCSLIGDFDVIDCRKTCFGQGLGQPPTPKLGLGGIGPEAHAPNEVDAPAVCDTRG